MLPVACTPRKNIYHKNSFFILRWKVTRVLPSFNSWFFKWLLLKPKGCYHQPEYHGTLIDASGSFKAKPFFFFLPKKKDRFSTLLFPEMSSFYSHVCSTHQGFLMLFLKVWKKVVCVLLSQLYLTLCDSIDCSPPCSSVHGILQAKIYWSGKPCPSLGVLPTLWLNSGLLHCRQTLYHLSHQGNHMKVFNVCLIIYVKSPPPSLT